jgi:succinate dehydrogenase/fumarate reductase flavoprotein subunit
MKITETFITDVLVIGAGASGLRAALAAAEGGSNVLIVNKGPVAKSGITLTAAGGMQAPFPPGDSPELYFQDTVNNGYGLADENLVRALAEDACARVLDAERYGVRFVRDAAGNYAYNQFPGQSQPRNLFIKGGGIGLAAALANACRVNEYIAILDDFCVTGLLKSKSLEETAVAGAIGLHLRTGQLAQIQAKAVVMATGGCQWLWEVNDCPADATGSGLIQAYRAGAELVDMEMVLFYPTVIIAPDSLQGAFVHYEYLDPAILDGNVYDAGGNAILPKPLPVRDEAMRLMAKALREGRGTARGGLFWHVGNSPKGQEAARKVLKTLQYDYIRAHGVEPATDRVEVAPGAHYLMGGIFVNEKCQTNVKGLYATAECAGNFDGANRLAGNGITGTQVFGARAGHYASDWATTGEWADIDPASVQEEVERVAGKIVAGKSSGPAIRDLQVRLRSAVQQYAGVSREATGLSRLLTEAAAIRAELKAVRVPPVAVFNQQLTDVLELEAMCEAASVIAGSAFLREESRGHHYRLDFPVRDDRRWQKHTVAVNGQTGPSFAAKAVVRDGSLSPYADVAVDNKYHDGF